MLDHPHDTAPAHISVSGAPCNEKTPVSQGAKGDCPRLDGYAWHRAVLSKICTLTASQKLVLLALVRHARRETGAARPAQRTIAAEASISERSAVRCLGVLVRAGIVEVRRRGLGRSNEYILPLHPAAVLAALTAPGSAPKASAFLVAAE